MPGVTHISDQASYGQVSVPPVGSAPIVVPPEAEPEISYDIGDGFSVHGVPAAIERVDTIFCEHARLTDQVTVLSSDFEAANRKITEAVTVLTG